MEALTSPKGPSRRDDSRTVLGPSSSPTSKYVDLEAGIRDLITSVSRVKFPVETEFLSSGGDRDEDLE